MEVPYRSWGLIPRDDAPSQGRPNTTNPPLMTTLALDAGGSLCFEIDAGNGSLQVRVSATGMSAEGRSDGFLRLFTGAEEGALRELPVDWDRGQDGLNAVFTASVDGVATTLKIHLAEPPTLIVNKVELEA